MTVVTAFWDREISLCRLYRRPLSRCRFCRIALRNVNDCFCPQCCYCAVLSHPGAAYLLVASWSVRRPNHCESSGRPMLALVHHLSIQAVNSLYRFPWSARLRPWDVRSGLFASRQSSLSVPFFYAHTLCPVVGSSVNRYTLCW